MQKMRFAVFKYIERNRGDKAPKAPQSPSSTVHDTSIQQSTLYVLYHSTVGTHSTLYVQSTVVVRNNSVTKKFKSDKPG